LLFLPLFSRAIVFAAAGLAECALSRETHTFIMGQHYAAVWIGYVLFAFALAATDLVAGNPARANVVLRTCGGLCMLVFLVANPMHPGRFLRPIEPRDVALDRFLANLPADAHVGTQEEAYTHLAFDPYATVGVRDVPRFVLIDDAYPASVELQWMEPALRAYVAAGRYRMTSSDGPIALYERGDRCKCLIRVKPSPAPRR